MTRSISLFSMAIVFFSFGAHAGLDDSNGVRIHHHAQFSPEGVHWSTTILLEHPVERLPLFPFPADWNFANDLVKMEDSPDGPVIVSEGHSLIHFQVDQPPGTSIQPPLLRGPYLQSVSFDPLVESNFIPHRGSGLERHTTNHRSRGVSKRAARRQKRKFPGLKAKLFYRGPPHPPHNGLGHLEPRATGRKRSLGILCGVGLVIFALGFSLFRKMTKAVDLERAEQVLQDDLNDFPV